MPEKEQQSLSLLYRQQQVIRSAVMCHLPKLQLHSPPVQKNGGGFIVNAWTERRGRQRQALGIWMHQEGQHQSRLQYRSQRQADARQNDSSISTT